MNRTNVNKSLNILLRLLIVAASLGYIYWKIAGKGNLRDLTMALQSFREGQYFYPGLSAVFLLMILNWSVETIKWKLLVSRITSLSFIRAFQSVLTGVTISIFTPNRTGEFIGRAFILKNEDPLKPVLLTIVGSLSQLLVTLLLGTLSLALLFRKVLPPGTAIQSWMVVGCISGIIMMNTLLVLLYFRMPFISRLFRETIKRKFSKAQDYLELIGEISRKELLKIFLLSSLRYFVFSLQFYLVLRAFGMQIAVIQCLLIISIIFLALAVIPTFALSELGVRGSVSLYFIGAYLLNTGGVEIDGRQSLAIVLSVGTLWMINLALPAIAGIPFVFKLRFFGK